MPGLHRPSRQLRAAVAAAAVLTLGGTWCTSAMADDVQARDNSVTVADQRLEVSSGANLPVAPPRTGTLLQADDNRLALGSDNQVPVTTDLGKPGLRCRNLEQTAERAVDRTVRDRVSVDNVLESRPAWRAQSACTITRPTSRTVDEQHTRDRDRPAGRAPIVRADGNDVRVLSGNTSG